MGSGERRATRRAVLRAALAVPGALGLAPLLAACGGGEQEADVCIIGSGPAGAVLGATLVERGVRTLLVESGPALDAPADPRRAGLDAYESAGPLTYPLAASRFRGAGGTSNLWTGVCPRLAPADFEPNPCTPVGAPWPIRYADLEPYYAAAEAALHVRGVDGLATAPPRRTPFPRPLPWQIPNLRRLLARTGVELALQPMPYSDDGGPPLNVARHQLPAFATSRRATLVTGLTARRLQCDADGRIDGVIVQALGAPPRRLRARAYVVACGGVESARLLLLSRSAAWPHGLGNRADLVGRGFMEHPAVVIGRGRVAGRWDVRSVRERGVIEQYIAAARRRGLGASRLRLLAEPRIGDATTLDLEVKAELEMAPSADNRVTLTDSRRDAFGDPGARLTLAFGDLDRRGIAFAEAAVRRVLTVLGADRVALTSGALRWLHHHLGTCRMGDDPRTSVVDRNLRVHGIDNLYVAGSAPFVTAGVANPTLTIVALSLRLADHLVAQLRR